MRYLIIGAGITGTTAAETIRNLDKESEVRLITNENYPLYSRITLASYAAGRVQKQNLMLRNKNQLLEKGILFEEGMTIKELHPESTTVIAENIEGTIKTFVFDKLLIATGGSPKKIPLEGSTAKGIFYMYRMEDADMINSYSHGKKKAVVVGGAFIGIDFVTTFLNLGLEVDFLIRGPRFLHKNLDEKSGTIVHSLLESKNVHVHTEEEIVNFNTTPDNSLQSVRTTWGIRMCDVIGLGLGIERITGFIKNSTLKYNKGIITNEYLETSIPNIYAAGDVAEYYDLITGETTVNGDWFSARLQGALVARNMTGAQVPYTEIPSNTSNIFGTNVTLVGNIANPEDPQSYYREDANKYIKVFTKNNVAIGAIAIGDNEFAANVKRAIKEKRTISSIDL